MTRHLALRPGKRRQLEPDGPQAKIEQLKARAKVEHPCRYVKPVFGYDKVRYRGLHKHSQRLAMLLGFANLMIARPCLAA